MDLYWWSDQEQKSESIYQQARENSVKNPQLDFKMAKALGRLEKTEEAKIIMDSLIAQYPEVAEYRTFENTLNQPKQ